jgi:hypothetical protein|tara:strand:+ start:967 stop:1686 length:720 start_codon:yes stop_codon:yes gene_type:complete
MNKKTYICNISGGHGHFLTYVFDKCCTTTKDIDESPFDRRGRSHQSYSASGNFVFIDAPEYFKKIKELQNENIIVISINDEVLYFERTCINRAGADVNLFNENEIEKFLRKHKSTFPDYCKEKNISIQEGYKYAFKFLDQSGAIKFDNERKNFDALRKNNVIFFPLKNYFNSDLFCSAITYIGKKFNIPLDMDMCKKCYDVFYSKNIVLQSHNNVYEYINGNKSIKLDILQQAYVDAQQ